MQQFDFMFKIKKMQYMDRGEFNGKWDKRVLIKIIGE